MAGLSVRAGARQLAAEEEGRVGAVSRSAQMHIAVVVVLPWVPAMASRRRWRAELGEQLAAMDDALVALAGTHQLRVVLGDRRRDDHIRVGRDLLGVVAELRLDAGRPQALHIGGLGAVGAAHLGAELLATSASPLIPAPPIAMKWSLRPSISATSAALSTSRAIRSAASGLASRRAAIDIVAEAVLVAEQLGDRGAQPLRR